MTERVQAVKIFSHRHLLSVATGTPTRTSRLSHTCASNTHSRDVHVHKVFFECAAVETSSPRILTIRTTLSNSRHTDGTTPFVQSLTAVHW